MEPRQSESWKPLLNVYWLPNFPVWKRYKLTESIKHESDPFGFTFPHQVMGWTVLEGLFFFHRFQVWKRWKTAGRVRLFEFFSFFLLFVFSKAPRSGTCRRPSSRTPVRAGSSRWRTATCLPRENPNRFQSVSCVDSVAVFCVSKCSSSDLLFGDVMSVSHYWRSR